MNKKEYKQPSLKAIELADTDIICQSDDLSPMSLFDEEVNDAQKPDDVSSDIWGSQW